MQQGKGVVRIRVKSVRDFALGCKGKKPAKHRDGWQGAWAASGLVEGVTVLVVTARKIGGGVRPKEEQAQDRLEA